MANLMKKHSISSKLAQKMVDEAVAKARKIGVSENVTILDDGAISRHSAGYSSNIYGGGAEGYTDYPFLDSVAVKTSKIGRESTQQR